MWLFFSISSNNFFSYLFLSCSRNRILFGFVFFLKKKVVIGMKQKSCCRAYSEPSSCKEKWIKWFATEDSRRRLPETCFAFQVSLPSTISSELLWIIQSLFHQGTPLRTEFLELFALLPSNVGFPINSQPIETNDRY